MSAKILMRLLGLRCFGPRNPKWLSSSLAHAPRPISLQSRIEDAVFASFTQRLTRTPMATAIGRNLSGISSPISPFRLEFFALSLNQVCSLLTESSFVCSSILLGFYVCRCRSVKQCMVDLRVGKSKP